MPQNNMEGFDDAQNEDVRSLEVKDTWNEPP